MFIWQASCEKFNYQGWSVGTFHENAGVLHLNNSDWNVSTDLESVVTIFDLHMRSNQEEISDLQR